MHLGLLYHTKLLSPSSRTFLQDFSQQHSVNTALLSAVKHLVSFKVSSCRKTFWSSPSLTCTLAKNETKEHSWIELIKEIFRCSLCAYALNCVLFSAGRASKGTYVHMKKKLSKEILIMSPRIAEFKEADLKPVDLH